MRRFLRPNTLWTWMLLGCAALAACTESVETAPPAPGAPPAELAPVPEERSADAPAGAKGAAKQDPWGEPSEREREMIAQLEAIGYADATRPAEALSGITVFDRARAEPGLNFYTSGHALEAVLMDMQGEVLHRWTADYDALFPDSGTHSAHPGLRYFRRAWLYPNGDILVIFEGLGLAKLDRDSRTLWTNANQAHHDLEVMPSGEIYVLTRQVSRHPGVRNGDPFLEDFVSVLDPEGRELRRFSLARALFGSPFRELYRGRSIRGWHPGGFIIPGDIFHTNTLEVLDGRLAARVPAFAAGNVLVSMPVLDAIAVVDLDPVRVVWANTGDYKSQHDPQVVGEGRVLLFDNKSRPGKSSVLEFDPETGREVWRYRGSSAHPFYSDCCGTVQRLSNDNTLITETEGGRAFEVTPGGEIVWEFRSPHRGGPRGALISSLFQLVRVPEREVAAWLDRD